MFATLDLKAVEYFLNICKKEIAKGNCHLVSERKITFKDKKISQKQALIDIGIMKIKDVWNYILELKPEECFKIDRDRDHSRDNNSEIYFFSKMINKKEVYIKLTFNGRGVVCISFHESKYSR